MMVIITAWLQLRKALQRSINVVSIRIADELGIDIIRNYYAKLLKFDKKTAKKRIPRNFSISLGSVEVSPFELTRAYAIIANGGRDVIPFSIRYIKDRNGKIIENREEEVKAILIEKKKRGGLYIIKPSTAQMMISMLRSVIAGGTGGGASIGRWAAGKTGTTNNWKDAWFVGFVPQFTTGIWIGYDKLGLSLGIGQAGGVITAPTWRKYMRAVLKKVPARGMPVYASLIHKEVCRKSGKLPSSDCYNMIKEIFTKKSLPEDICTICPGIEHNVKLARKGPRDNISRDQKSAILKSLKKKKSNESIIDKIDDDLIEP